MAPERIEWHLLNWQRWMRHGGMPHFHVRALSLGSGFSSRTSFDDMCDSNDQRLAHATDAVIRDLGVEYRLALESFYLGRRWTLVLMLTPTVDEARVRVGIGLTKQGIV
jgi:hypothetical protein